MGRLVDVFTAPRGGAPMERHRTVAVDGGGIVGDRYRTGEGHFAPYDVCAVTLVAGEALDAVEAEYGIDLSDGRHRRNLVVRGVDLHDLLEATFTVGDVRLRGTRPRPPCAHLEAVADEDGVTRALAEGRGGICADVVDGGELSVGDELEVVEADPRTVGRAIAERLRGSRSGSESSHPGPVPE